MAREEMVSHAGQSPSEETAPRRQPGGPLAYEKGDQRPLNARARARVLKEEVFTSDTKLSEKMDTRGTCHQEEGLWREVPGRV